MKIVRRNDGRGGEDLEAAPNPSESAGRVAAVTFAALLFFPIKDLFDSHVSALRMGLALAGVAVFFVVYLWRRVFGPMTPRPSGPVGFRWVWRRRWWSPVVGDSPERWAPLFIFVSAVIGVRVGLPWAAYGIAACTVLSAAALVSTAPIENVLAIAVQTLAVGAFTVGMRKLRATINELQEARQQLARLAVAEERLRFARDLHDLLGQSLSVIALKADTWAGCARRRPNGLPKRSPTSTLWPVRR